MLNSGTVPDILSRSFDDCLSSIADDIINRITVSNRVKSTILGLLTTVTVALDDLIVPLNFMTVGCSLFDVIIGYPALESKSGIIDLGKRVAHLFRKGNTYNIPVIPEYKLIKEVH